MNPDIRHFLAPEDVLLDIDAPHFDALLGVLGAHIESRHGVAAQHGHAILARREALSSTAIGAGVAIPHARLDGLARSSACLLYTSPSPRDKRQYRMPSSA